MRGRKAPDVGRVIRLLRSRYGYDPRTQLTHRNIRELFVSALLSPQCTDKQVNTATVGLFKRYRAFDDYASASLAELRRYLKGLNYYRTKARNLKGSARMITERFNGKVPRTIAEMTELPGVGRKVANVVLNEGFGIDEGIAVDTHCAVVAGRLGYSRSRDPYKIELDLMRKVPREYWRVTSDLFIELGRDTCKAARKECGRCVLNRICPSSDVV